MSVTVRIPGVLRAEAGGNATLEFGASEGTTLGGILDEIGATWPLLERRLRDERGQLRRYVNVYVDGEECRRLDGLGTPIHDRTEVLVIPSVAGG
jgi:molybdopterin converting factor small subunit